MNAPGPTRRGLLGGGLAAAAAGWAAGPAAASTTTPSATRSTSGDDDLPLTVTLLEVTPTSYDAADPARSLVTVRARVRNTSRETLTGLGARLVVQRSATAAREALASWATASETRSTGRAPVSSDPADVGADGELAAGASAVVTLVLAASAIGTAPGAHPASVEVRDASARQGITRTFLVSAAAAGTAEPTRLTMLLPLVAGRVEPSALAEDPSGGAVPSVAELADLVDGRLGRLLAAGADPRTAWALDPALLLTAEAARPAATTDPLEAAATSAPETDDDSAPTSAQVQTVTGWLDDLRAAAAGRTVLTLDFGDPDVASLARSGAGPRLADAARTAAAGATDGLGTTADLLTDVVWPADGQADDDVLDAAAAQGATTVVLADDSLAPDDDLTFTPSGRADVAAGSGRLDAVVADRTLSDLLSAVTTDAEDGSGSGSGGGGGQAPASAATVQRVLAEIATVTLQRPNDPRSLLLTTPRSFDPDPGAVGALTVAVEESGWGRWQSLRDLLAVPAADAGWVGPRLSAAVSGSGLSTGHLAAVASALTSVDAFATALSTQDAAADPAVLARRRAALLLMSTSWRGHTGDLPRARRALVGSLEGLSAGIRIVAGSVRNLAATRSELPITLVNELDVPVQVDLVLTPRTPRVQLDAVPRQTIPARSQQRVAVPVRALANGSVVIDASLLTPAGTPVGQSVDVDLNVRMDVETWLTAIVGGGAGALLVAGVWRAVRRGRRRVDEVEHADVGADESGTPPEQTPPEQTPPDGSAPGEPSAQASGKTT